MSPRCAVAYRTGRCSTGSRTTLTGDGGTVGEGGRVRVGEDAGRDATTHEGPHSPRGGTAHAGVAPGRRWRLRDTQR